MCFLSPFFHPNSFPNSCWWPLLSFGRWRLLLLDGCCRIVPEKTLDGYMTALICGHLIYRSR
jgi:hypothetical protein